MHQQKKNVGTAIRSKPGNSKESCLPSFTTRKSYVSKMSYKPSPVSEALKLGESCKILKTVNPQLLTCLLYSIRQWRNKIKDWGLERNFKASDMRILVAKKEKRARHRGVETVFCYQGKNIENERIDRFIKREGAIVGDQPSPSTGTHCLTLENIYYEG